MIGEFVYEYPKHRLLSNKNKYDAIGTIFLSSFILKVQLR